MISLQQLPQPIPTMYQVQVPTQPPRKVKLKYEGQNWPGLAKFQPATEIDQLQLTFFVLKIESGYFFLWNMIGIHT